jgi:hypothetical protein
LFVGTFTKGFAFRTGKTGDTMEIEFGEQLFKAPWGKSPRFAGTYTWEHANAAVISSFMGKERRFGTWTSAGR